jgi:hypothetical protein
MVKLIKINMLESLKVRLLSQLGLKSIRSDETKLKISINNSRSKTVVITNIESGSKVEFPSITFFFTYILIYVKKKS